MDYFPQEHAFNAAAGSSDTPNTAAYDATYRSVKVSHESSGGRQATGGGPHTPYFGPSASPSPSRAVSTVFAAGSPNPYSPTPANAKQQRKLRYQRLRSMSWVTCLIIALLLFIIVSVPMVYFRREFSRIAYVIPMSILSIVAYMVLIHAFVASDMHTATRQLRAHRKKHGAAVREADEALMRRIDNDRRARLGLPPNGPHCPLLTNVDDGDDSDGGTALKEVATMGSPIGSGAGGGFGLLTSAGSGSGNGAGSPTTATTTAAAANALWAQQPSGVGVLTPVESPAPSESPQTPRRRKVKRKRRAGAGGHGAVGVVGTSINPEGGVRRGEVGDGGEPRTPRRRRASGASNGGGRNAANRNPIAASDEDGGAPSSLSNGAPSPAEHGDDGDEREADAFGVANIPASPHRGEPIGEALTEQEAAYVSASGEVANEPFGRASLGIATVAASGGGGTSGGEEEKAAGMGGMASRAVAAFSSLFGRGSTTANPNATTSAPPFPEERVSGGREANRQRARQASSLGSSPAPSTNRGGASSSQQRAATSNSENLYLTSSSAAHTPLQPARRLVPPLANTPNNASTAPPTAQQQIALEEHRMARRVAAAGLPPPAGGGGGGSGGISIRRDGRGVEGEKDNFDTNASMVNTTATNTPLQGRHSSSVSVPLFVGGNSSSAAPQRPVTATNTPLRPTMVADGGGGGASASQSRQSGGGATPNMATTTNSKMATPITYRSGAYASVCTPPPAHNLPQLQALAAAVPSVPASADEAPTTGRRSLGSRTPPPPPIAVPIDSASDGEENRLRESSPAPAQPASEQQQPSTVTDAPTAAAEVRRDTAGSASLSAISASDEEQQRAQTAIVPPLVMPSSSAASHGRPVVEGAADDQPLASLVPVSRGSSPNNTLQQQQSSYAFNDTVVIAGSAASATSNSAERSADIASGPAMDSAAPAAAAGAGAAVVVVAAAPPVAACERPQEQQQQQTVTTTNNDNWRHRDAAADPAAFDGAGDADDPYAVSPRPTEGVGVEMGSLADASAAEPRADQLFVAPPPPKQRSILKATSVVPAGPSRTASGDNNALPLFVGAPLHGVGGDGGGGGGGGGPSQQSPQDALTVMNTHHNTNANQQGAAAAYGHDDEYDDYLGSRFMISREVTELMFGLGMVWGENRTMKRYLMATELKLATLAAAQEAKAAQDAERAREAEEAALESPRERTLVRSRSGRTMEGKAGYLRSVIGHSAALQPHHYGDDDAVGGEEDADAADYAPLTAAPLEGAAADDDGLVTPTAVLRRDPTSGAFSGGDTVRSVVMHSCRSYYPEDEDGNDDRH